MKKNVVSRCANVHVVYVCTLFFFSYGNLFGVRIQEQPSEKSTIVLYKKLPYPLEIKVFGGKNEYTEDIDLKGKCPIAQISFKKLIKVASEQKRSFILAAVLTEGNEKNIFQRSYFNASYLYKWMFEQNTFQRKKDSSFSNHVVFKKEIIKPISFFAIDSLNCAFKYSGNENVFSEDSEESFLLKYNIIAGLENGEALNLYGVFCHNNNKSNYAERCWIRAMSTYDYPDAIYNLGVLYKMQSKFELAEKYYLLAIEKHGHVSAMNGLGFLYKKQNKTELAKKYFNDAIKKGNMRSCYHLGMIYKNENNLKMAKEYFERAANGGDEDAQKELSF